MSVWDGLSDISDVRAEKNPTTSGVIVVANDLGGSQAEI